MICVFCGKAFMPGEMGQVVNKPTTNQRPPVVVRLCHERCLGRFRTYDQLQGYRNRVYWMGDEDGKVDGSGGMATGDTANS